MKKTPPNKADRGFLTEASDPEIAAVRRMYSGAPYTPPTREEEEAQWGIRGITPKLPASNSQLPNVHPDPTHP